MGTFLLSDIRPTWIFMSEELLASYHTNGQSRGQYPNVFNTAKGALLKLLHGKLWTPRLFFFLKGDVAES